MEYNYQIVLFKNKVKKKIINKFKTHKKAVEFYNDLLKENDEVIFDKEFENGVKSNYELAIIEKVSGTLLPVFLKDEIGRTIKVKSALGYDKNTQVYKAAANLAKTSAQGSAANAGGAENERLKTNRRMLAMRVNGKPNCTLNCTCLNPNSRLKELKHREKGQNPAPSEEGTGFWF